jgi:pyruvate/2-oxoglutarate dehydrogenase complex dihydrolipoamide dehydrogenase (E3) component
VLATGARARELPGLEADGDLVWTYRHALVPPRMPKTLLVIGSGAIGIEFASFYNTLGAKTTVVEVMDRILPVEDAEISAFAKKSFEKQGMTILQKATVKKLDRGRARSPRISRQAARPRRRSSTPSSPPSASSATSRGWGSRRWGSRSTAPMS